MFVHQTIQLFRQFLYSQSVHKSQYVADTGGELSLANANANFGENALMSEMDFKKSTFTPDNAAYITHIHSTKKLLMELMIHIT